jgi:hypothetical protein
MWTPDGNGEGVDQLSGRIEVGESLGEIQGSVLIG